jgi:hypothetical protein
MKGTPVKMKTVDRLLHRIGLMRISQMPYRRCEIDFGTALEPAFVDIELTGGHRLRGHVDPWWPNKRPNFTHGDNPFLLPTAIPVHCCTHPIGHDGPCVPPL